MALHDFDRLLKQAGSDEGGTGPGVVAMTLDLEEHRIVESTVWTRVRSARYRRFIVRTAEDADAYVEDRELQVVLGDYEGEDVPLRLRVEYQARCLLSDAASMVTALGVQQDARGFVHKRLKFWVEEFAREHPGSFIDDFEKHAGDLRRQLKDRALRLLGLTLKLKIKLVGQDGLKSVAIGPTELAVRLEGLPQKLKVRFEVDLPADQRALGKAVQYLSQVERLEAEVLGEVTRFLETEVTLHQFHRELEGTVKARLHERLQQLMGRWGREVGHLHLKALTPLDGVADSYESRHEFERHLAEYPEPVRIQTVFLLVLEDAGRYLHAGSPKLENWARTSIEEAARQVLFSAKYTELVRTVDHKKAEIEQKVTAQARAIGYQIQQFIAITNLQVDRLRVPFPVVVRERFPTKAPDVLAGLEIRVTARIPELTRIEKYLDKREDVVAVMTSFIRDHVADVLHGVEPEEFYLYFSTPMPARAPAKGRLPIQDDEAAFDEEPPSRPGREKKPQTLERRLRHGLGELLAREFGAEVSQIVFKESDDAIAQLLRDLHRRARPFEVTVKPRGGRELPAVFSMKVLVNAVDPRGWHNFLTKRPDMDTIVETIQGALTGLLGQVLPEELYYMQYEKLLPHLNRWAAERIGTEFGLHVQLTDLQRHATSSEVAETEIAEAAVARRRADDLARLDQVGNITRAQLESQSDRVHALLKEQRDVLERLHSNVDLNEDEREELRARKEAIAKEIDDANLRPGGAEGVEDVLARRKIRLVEPPTRTSLSLSAAELKPVSLLGASDGDEHG